MDDPNIKYYKDNLNYQTYEPLVGWIDTTGDGSKKSFKFENRVHVQKPGLYGQCSDVSVISLLDPIPSSSCGFHKQPLTKDFCEKTLDISNILKMKLSKDATDGNEISIQKGVVKKYNYQGTFEKNIENTDDEMKAWTGTPTFEEDTATG